MNYSIIDTGGSRSFPTSHPLLDGKSDSANVVLFIGNDAGEAFRNHADIKAMVAMNVWGSTSVKAAPRKAPMCWALPGFASEPATHLIWSSW